VTNKNKNTGTNNTEVDKAERELSWLISLHYKSHDEPQSRRD
jgi:hypothetical protein